MPTQATIVAHLDAPNERIVLQWVDVNDQPIAGRGTVTIDLSDLRGLGLSESNLVVRMRLEHAKDSITCSPVKRGVLATDWEPDV